MSEFQYLSGDQHARNLDLLPVTWSPILWQYSEFHSRYQQRDQSTKENDV